MPETAIGLHPDVGASYFLSRLSGHLGTSAISYSHCPVTLWFNEHLSISFLYTLNFDAEALPLSFRECNSTVQSLQFSQSLIGCCR